MNLKPYIVFLIAGATLFAQAPSTPAAPSPSPISDAERVQIWQMRTFYFQQESLVQAWLATGKKDAEQKMQSAFTAMAGKCKGTEDLNVSTLACEPKPQAPAPPEVKSATSNKK